MHNYSFQSTNTVTKICITRRFCQFLIQGGCNRSR